MFKLSLLALIFLAAAVSSVASSDECSRDSSSSSEEAHRRRSNDDNDNDDDGGAGDDVPPVPGSDPRPNAPEAPGRGSRTTCPAGWTRVQRKVGGWCVKVFQGVVNQAQAESGCASNGAVLSGVETNRERQTIAELGKNLMESTGWKYGTLRTGLRRSTKQSAWTITDGHTSGMEGIVWSPGEPGSGSYDGFPNNCGMMWIWVTGGKQVKQREHGKFFSMICPKTWNDRFRGYVCGKLAT
ncbi:unnamed protein product [Caenorhabditis sp. 36 PRJEB53466]|nr:unnamed protein product [Caenorhabditis sp. 36 PRJEB53466]